MMMLYRIAERVRQNEYQNALALGYDTLDAINSSWAAYNGVMLGPALCSNHEMKEADRG